MDELASRRVDVPEPVSGLPAPGRTVTFLFTDIEGSTRLWEQQREAMSVAVAAHDATLRAVVEGAGGSVVKTTGDGMLAAFDRAESALSAAVEAQRALSRQAWPTKGPLTVRMAVHTGTAEARDGDFFGPTLNRAARLLAVGHGGQVLVSGASAAVAVDGLPPGGELLDLGERVLRDLDRTERIYQLAVPGLRRDFPPLRAASHHESNLPEEFTSFVGRGPQLADVAKLLETARLVTLVGVGGTGKTRLALRAAADALDRHRDGVWLVELAPLSDPGLVVDEIGRALRIHAQPGQPPLDALVDYLRSKDLLLVLDNCEHLVDTVVGVTHRLLASCHGIVGLATSREPLGLDGEAVYAVPSMALPVALETDGGRGPADEDIERIGRSEAVALFVERARSTLPSFSLDASNLGPVTEICRRLDGIPLALELAAARVNVLSPAEIAEGLSDRFRLLTGGRRTALPRQRTLQALVDWSWDLLDDADRRLLRGLAVFAGGWTLEAATHVTWQPLPGGADSAGAVARVTTLDGLSRLVDRSLIAVDRTGETDRAGATRYRMLETIRQYAADRLGESGETLALRDRHLAVYRELARDAEAGLDGPEMPAWLTRIDTEVDNLRSALEWALDTRPLTALEMCVALTRYWRARVMGSEGLDRMVGAIEAVRRMPAAETEPETRQRAVLVARGRAAAALLALHRGHPEGPRMADEAVTAAQATRDPAAIVDAASTYLMVQALLPGGRDVEAWQTTFQDALAAASSLGDPTRLARLQSTMAMIDASNDPQSADAWLERAGEAALRSGNPQEIAAISQTRGRVASRTGRLADAQRWFAHAQGQFHELGDRRFELSAQSELAHVLRRSGDLDAAQAEYRQAIRGWQRSGNRGAVANQLESMAFIALARGEAERSVRLLGAADALREASGSPMMAQERAEYEDEVQRLRTALAGTAFDEGWAVGRAMSVEAAVALALSG